MNAIPLASQTLRVYTPATRDRRNSRYNCVLSCHDGISARCDGCSRVGRGPARQGVAPNEYGTRDANSRDGSSRPFFNSTGAESSRPLFYSTGVESSRPFINSTVRSRPARRLIPQGWSRPVRSLIPQVRSRPAPATYQVIYWFRRGRRPRRPAGRRRRRPLLAVMLLCDSETAFGVRCGRDDAEGAD